MKARLPIVAALLTGLVGFGREALPGQTPPLMDSVTTNIDPPMTVPFGPGELLEYDVKLGVLGKRGAGFMSVDGLETVRGRTTYRITMAYEGGLWFAKVKDHFKSWLDVANLVTLRSVEDTKQINRERFKHFEFFPETRTWERQDNGRSGEMPTSEPLDQISFFYFVRTLPLEVGEEYSFNRYFKESGNPVILRVLRRDTVEVPAGTFPTIVVQPVIRSSGLFGEGGEAKLYLSDDPRRLLVLMESDIPIVGRLSLHLREITEGNRLTTIGQPPVKVPPDPGG